MNLNCEIWIIWNQSKSVKLEGDRRISFGVRSSFEVLQSNKWSDEYIDLPNLKEIELGNCVFVESLSTIIESMF